ncbi:MAG: peptidylprolyl isomerase [Patescibacteria group bacterium]|jgi:peptidyl-prolyl cis-trans isomerase B (cyclophilin B)
MKNFFILFFISVIFSGCALGRDLPEGQTKLNGAIPASYNESDILYQINQLKTGNMSQPSQSGENNEQTSAVQGERIELENLFSTYNQALIKTNFGDIKVQFYEESPLTVNNFMNLSQREFYNGTKFHRVIKDFMIQGGDPNSKNEDWNTHGIGGPGYKFQDEINQHALVRGSLAMANSGLDTNGSQFFIVTKEATPWLDGLHTNFGEVIEGMDVVDKIESIEVNANSHPTQDVIIENIILLNSDDGYKLDEEELEELENSKSTSIEEDAASTTEE